MTSLAIIIMVISAYIIITTDDTLAGILALAAFIIMALEVFK